LLLSVFRLTQVPLQSVVPLGQVHALLAQLFPPVQGLLQAPQ
jgi:hypothetical protein